MTGFGYQCVKQVVVPVGTTNVPLPPSRPVLESFVVWATSGTQVLTDVTFQLQLNGLDVGSDTAIAGAAVNEPVLGVGITLTGAPLIPMGPPPGMVTQPCVFTVEIVNAGPETATLTLFFVGIGRN